MTQRQRLLVIGSASTTGVKLVQALSEQKASRRPIIFAFCKTSSRLDPITKERCNRVIEGDYRDERDIARALRKSKADTVIFVPANSTLPTSSARATETVLQQPAFRNVKYFLVSENVSTSSKLQSELRPEICKSTKKTTRKGPSLQKALEGLSAYWSAIPVFASCSDSDHAIIEESSSSSSSSSEDTTLTSLSSWRGETENLPRAPSGTSRDRPCSDDERRDAVEQPSPLHVKVDKNYLVDFVVGAVMDENSLYSLGGSNHTRDITVTAE